MNRGKRTNERQMTPGALLGETPSKALAPLCRGTPKGSKVLWNGLFYRFKIVALFTP